MADFVHLHLHTEYSLLDGACRIDRLFDRAIEYGQSAVAITDHGVMYGAPEFFKKAKAKGIKPIIGCEMYVSARSLTEKSTPEDRHPCHLVLLAKNETGYHNLIKLNSIAHVKGFYQKPRIDIPTLEKYSEGLIATSACMSGAVARFISNGETEKAKLEAENMKRIFGDDYYLEIQDHDFAGEKAIMSVIVGIARELNIKLVATNDVHYLDKGDAESQEVLMCIQTNATLGDSNAMHFPTNEFYLKSSEEMAELFSDIPEAIENTVEIADKCSFEFDFTKHYLPSFTNPEGTDNEEYLRSKCENGLKALVREGFIGEGDIPKYRERMEYELDTICRMGFCEYYLIVRDFIQYAKKNSISVGPGRGSGAGSLCAYLVGITGIDPIKHDLLFERFLNPERVSMPDFDIDFCFERRHEVIDYVRSKYGDNRVSQIITFNTLAAKAVVRDVGRVLNMDYADVDKIAKLIPRALDMTLVKALEITPELKKLYDTSPMAKRLIDISSKLEGMPRHPSIHAAGVVITDKAISDYVPLCMSGDVIITQYTMNEIADLGLLKIDFLGLRYLTVIDKASRLVKEKDRDFDIESIDINDKKVFEYMSAGNTSGMFQIESGGMKNLIMRMKPESVEDITAAIALYRPGPMDSIPRYIENSKNRDKIKYDPESLRDILSVTYGCIVYQEQVMQILRALAGFTFGHADIVRRAMAKKKADVMASERQYFIYGSDDPESKCDGAVKRGISEKRASEIYGEMSDFAKYAFNKSHACAYSYLTYRTAYLKYYYPHEFMSSLMNAYLGDESKVGYYISECRNMGIEVKSPDVNESLSGFSVSGNAVYYGLLAVKNTGTSAVRSIIEERQSGKFKSFEDFLIRMSKKELNKKMTESLIMAGAFDSLHNNRAELLAVFEKAIDMANDITRNNVAGQLDMFSSPGETTTMLKIEYPSLPDEVLFDKLRYEKSVTGVYLSGHPLDGYKKQSEKCSKIADIKRSFEANDGEFADGKIVDLLCIIDNKKLKETKNKSVMAYVDVSDCTDSAEIIVFPKVYENSAAVLLADNVVIAKCEINYKDDGIGLLAKTFVPAAADDKIESRQMQKEKRLYLKFSSKSSDEIKKVSKILSRFGGGDKAIFYFEDEKKYFELKNTGIGISDELLTELKAFLSGDRVVVK